jgi:hypothetical protein
MVNGGLWPSQSQVREAFVKAGQMKTARVAARAGFTE